MLSCLYELFLNLHTVIDLTLIILIISSDHLVFTKRAKDKDELILQYCKHQTFGTSIERSVEQ
jgi:hypothetical protein